MDICLALGGGGTRGIAHLGVIDCLESNGFRICSVAGTSIGALVGGLYAAGCTTEKIKQTLQSFDMTDLYRRRHEDGPSLLGAAGLVEALSDLLRTITFADLRIPFACTAVDINSSKEVFLKQGSVMEAVLASSAFPGVLPPYQVGDALLVDGGILDPVPVALARSLSPSLPVIAVVLQPCAEDWGRMPEANIMDTAPMPIPLPSSIIHTFSRLRIGQAMRIFTQSMDINSRMVAELRLKIDRPDVIIRPDVVQFGMFEMVDADKLIEKGTAAAQNQLKEIRQAASWHGNVNRFFRRITPINEPTVLKQDKPVAESDNTPEEP
jgi:NTE family protein